MMTVNERIDDISKRSGLSKEVVKRVIEASRESIIDSLSKNERATLPGVCTFNPERTRRIEISEYGNVNNFIKVKAKPSSIIESTVKSNTGEIKDIESTEREEVTEISTYELKSYYGIKTKQIQSLM